MSQNLMKPTLEDVIPGGQTFRFAENLYGVQWWGDVCLKPTIDSLLAVDPKTGKESLVATREEINQALQQQELGKLSHLYRVSMPSKGRKQILLSMPGTYALYDQTEKKIVETRHFPKESANTDYHTASGNIAYTMGNNLYVNGNAVTQEPEGVVCGQSVHRHEFGISKGTFWSPKGNLLAFYRMDESMVTEYPLVDITARVGKLNSVRYPMAGMTSHEVTVGVYNPETQHTIYLQTGNAKDRYFTNISWSADAKTIYLIELNRDQNHAVLCAFDATTGKRIDGFGIEETHPKYVEPQNPILFLPWDDTKFIFQSQRSGYNHIYLADTKATVEPTTMNGEAGGAYTETCKVTQLTKGNWLVKEVIGFCTEKKEVIFSATKESPLQSNIYKLKVSSGRSATASSITALDNGEGVHSASLSSSGNFFIDTYSTPQVSRSINIASTKPGKSINLLTASNPYDGLEMPIVETGVMKAADGVTDLYFRMVKPANFDPTQKYPAIVYVYGGPHAQMITNGWMHSTRGWDIYMASKGYVMFTLDNRGSSNRGLEFENSTFRNLGIEEGKDQLIGAEYLKSLPYIDESRIGVHGWSFGGHMTTALMLRYPYIYKVGVAGGPVIDWSYYEVMYGERYMDTPETNPEGYKDTNLSNLAGNLVGHLLIIHDDHDDTCVPQHTLSFIKACVDARTYPDLFIYPGHKHNVMGRDRVHLHQKITKYFEDNL